MRQSVITISGTEYQKGPRYGFETQKEALLYAQGYKCAVCGKTLIGCRSVIHHRGYRIGDRSNRLNNLAAIHDYEHTPKNHQPGGKLYNLKPADHSFANAAFMNTVRWYILNEIKENYSEVTVSHIYGAETKMHRKDLGIRKSHANDAYAMGDHHPIHRSKTQYWQKNRRNNRILSKFYDAKYIDIRDGSKKSGSQLSCNRTKRSIPRNNSRNERKFRCQKVSKGRLSLRKKHYGIQPGDVLVYRGKIALAKGVHCNGTRVVLENNKSVKIADLHIKKKKGGWQFLPAL